MGRLIIEGLRVLYTMPTGVRRVIEDVDLTLDAGRALGIVGESGSGKTTLARTLMRALPSNGRIDGGQIRLGQRDLRAMSEESFRKEVRWREIAMIFQGASQPFNPVLRIGNQIVETIRNHEAVSTEEAWARASALFERVGLAPARLAQYPHQLSGGMRQRAAIALALACDPRLLIADEPTSALDLLVQAQILHLLDRLRNETGLSLLLITHDLSVVAQVCDDVAVMYGGQIVEYGPVEMLLRQPQHPYTRSLLAALPERSVPSTKPTSPLQTGAAPTKEPIAQGEGLRKVFHLRPTLRQRVRGERPLVRAVDGVDLTLHPGEVVGLVGESGSGKTTVARMMMWLERPTEGRVLISGDDLSALPSKRLRERRRTFQMVMQDPYDAMNPRMNVFDVIAEPLRVQGGAPPREALLERVRAALVDVELSPPERFIFRPIRSLSGGEQQRVAIARALILAPRLLIADEPVSMLDASTRRDVVNLFARLVRERSLALLFITHDLVLARHLCDRIAVMYRGRIVEEGPAESLVRRPHHPYTQALFAAVPTLDSVERGRAGIDGALRLGTEDLSPSSNAATSAGCPLTARCPLAIAPCQTLPPERRPVTPGHTVACHRAEEAWELFRYSRGEGRPPESSAGA